MAVESTDISVRRKGHGAGIEYDGQEFVRELGIGLPIAGNWLWSFDGSLKMIGERQDTGRDGLGEYRAMELVYAAPEILGPDTPLIRQSLKAYAGDRLLVETTVLEDISGTYNEDSFYATTFNSPTLILREGLNFLAYTWGLIGAESTRDGGHFPEAVAGKVVSSIPARLRTAGFSSREDLRTDPEKPFAPLALYDDEQRTLVISPFNHFLISPLRTIATPSGAGVARGLHGSVDVLPRGTTLQTALVFGHGVVETVLKWGDWLLEAGKKKRDPSMGSPLLESIGFWNCFGGYYTELFRKVDEGVLSQLAAYFRERKIPIRYFGLDLWYEFDQVGFAKRYDPDATKYPKGLGAVHSETGLPYLLHMSAFESPNDYVGRYEFDVDEAASYPIGRGLYDNLAQSFKELGGFGIWPDFLRTQMQNCRSLRSRLGNAEGWFDDLAEAFSDQGLGIMMCMPTIGHYLASTRHQNVVAVRTHSDYINHQKGQVEVLRASDQIRNFLPFQESVKHNALLSLLAHALGLRPSYDVFLTNADHPEGFAEPNAHYEALLRAMSAGVVGVGDKVGFIDKGIIDKLCFPDGRLSSPDHPPLPCVSTLQSDVLAFYTTTTVGHFRWVYLAAFNVGDTRGEYDLDVRELSGDAEPVVYDYFRGSVLRTSALQGHLDPGEGHYYVIMPAVGTLHLLGFAGKYVTASGRQVVSIDTDEQGVTVGLRLAASPGGDQEPRSETPYAFAVHSRHELEAWAEGADIRRVALSNGLVSVEFVPTAPEPILHFLSINR